MKSKSEPEPEPPRRVSRQLKKMLSAPKIGLRVAAAAAAFGQHQKNIQSTKEKKGREKENRGDVCCASVATILCSLSLSLTHSHTLSFLHTLTHSFAVSCTHTFSLSHSLCRTFALWVEQVWKTISLSCLCRTEVLAFYEFFRFEIKRNFSEASFRFRL